MHTFFLADIPPDGGVVTLDPEESRHLKVRRLRPDETVRVVDGRGGSAEGRYIGRNELALERPTQQQTPRIRFILIQAVIPSERLDWALQKAVECGVAEIIVYGAERKAGKELGRKEDRWARIAREAAKQCGRADFPPISWRPDLSTALATAAVDSLWMADQGGERPAFMGSPARVGLVVGPEGGLTPNERRLLAEADAQAVSLGPYTLRSETVAPAGLALLQWGYSPQTGSEADVPASQGAIGARNG